MKFLIKDLNTLTQAFTKLKNQLNGQLKSKGFPKEYILLTEDIKPKRSKKQLRAYWRLIEVIRSWMNEWGNDFTTDEVVKQFDPEGKIVALRDTPTNSTSPNSISPYGASSRDKQDGQDKQDNQNNQDNQDNNKRNNFTKEQVDCYFKIIGGHYENILGINTPKSISDKSDCTKEDMKIILNRMLDFGKVWNIPDCYLMKEEWEEILSNFRD
jgi:hypothetical protein